jgi:hypothetical protein
LDFRNPVGGNRRGFPLGRQPLQDQAGFHDEAIDPETPIRRRLLNVHVVRLVRAPVKGGGGGYAQAPSSCGKPQIILRAFRNSRVQLMAAFIRTTFSILAFLLSLIVTLGNRK